MTESVDVGPTGVSGVRLVGTLTARVRTNFALQHLLGASRFARQVWAVEQANQGQPFGPFFEELIHLVTATVTLSVASIEAFANEMFADGNVHFPNMPNEVLDTVWSLAERGPFMEKYDVALALRSLPPLDKGGAIYQNADSVVHMRNALIHFNPEWDNSQVKHKKLSTRLEHQFTPSPFLSPHDPLFPKRCMSHGCAEWSVRSAMSFLADFENRMGMEHKINAGSSNLATK